MEWDVRAEDGWAEDHQLLRERVAGRLENKVTAQVVRSSIRLKAKLQPRIASDLHVSTLANTPTF